MQEHLTELMSVLTEEKNIYDELLEISKNKKNIIVEGNVNELEKITKTEQSIMIELSKLEDRREDNIQRIADIIGIEPQNLTISKLAEHVDHETGKKLRDMRDTIMKVLKELKDLNALNSKLINSSMEYIEFSLGLLTSAVEADNNYTMDAERKGSKGKNFFDLKV